MIPSDHFVKFYSEIFKYLQKQSPEALEGYFATIGQHQISHLEKIFKEKGLQGMDEYWQRIIIEENCDADSFVRGKCYSFYMHGCPSLGKVIDNDAGVCDIYCEHCPGWVLPLMTKSGFYCVYDLIRKDIPRCILKAFEDLDDAKKYLEVVKKRHPDHPELVKCNFQQ